MGDPISGLQIAEQEIDRVFGPEYAKFDLPGSDGCQTIRSRPWSEAAAGKG